MARVIRADHEGPRLIRTSAERAQARAEAAALQEAYHTGLRNAQQPLYQALARLWAIQEKHLQALEEAVIPLARAISAKLVPTVLEKQPELIVELARPLLQALRGATTIRIQTHAEDAPHLRAALREQAIRAGLAPDQLGALGLTIIEDPDRCRGSLVLESDIGALDGRLETRLSLIEGALRRASGHTEEHAVESI